MDELHMCHYCGQPLEDLSQLHDITHCAKYAIETSIPTLQKRVEELNGEVKKWQDICTLSDDRAIVCIGNERALRASLNEAVKEIEAKAYEENTAFANRIQFMLVLEILRKHGLVEDK